MTFSRRDFVAGGVAALAAPFLLNCGSGTTEPDRGDPRLSARPGTPTVTPTIGLTSLDLGSSRDGYLYVPAGYDPATPAPLFVALHGAGGSAESWNSYRQRADDRGMVLLTPDSRGRTWDILSGAFGPDAEFIDLALAHTFARCRIDPARIALGGFSDGASYALSLGVSNGDLFTHLVAYSPGFIVAIDPIVGDPDIYVSHGTSDPILPVETTRDVIVPGLEQAGYDVTLNLFAGGHEVPAAVSEAALDWFLA